MRLAIILTTLLLSLDVYSIGQTPAAKPGGSKYAKQILREEDPSFFRTADAVRIGDQVLLWQRDTGGWPKNLIDDPQNVDPIWARFYDLDNCLPFVCDRDGIPKRNLDEIGSERRNGYSWCNERPAALYGLYEEWTDKHDPENKVRLVK